MKKLTIFFIVFIFLFNLNIFAKTPNPNAKGAILIDANTGRVLWAKNQNQPMAMASTTKIMTAILAIERGNLEDIVKVSKNAVKAPKVKMYLKEGEEIKLKNLLYALMMQSSNDAAIAIAEHISPNVETFCNEMTQKAKEIGAKDTVFKTPNGLDLENHHSTPYDMALIAKYAMNNETFVKIINQKQISFKTNKSSYDILNKNRLLNEYNGANGIKTGYTNKAGHCFVGSAKRGDLSLISVVFASGWGNKGKEQKWIDTKQILNYGFENFKNYKILQQDNLEQNLQINKGNKDEISLYYENEIVLPLTNEEINNIKIQNNIPKILEAPIYKDQKIGTCQIILQDEILAEVNILAKESVEKNTFISNFKNIIKNWVNMIN